MSIVPPFLTNGDTILLIATARKTSPAEVEPVADALRSWGLKVEYGPNLFKEHHQFSGTDEERCLDLQWALDHPNAKAIIIARGGYGTIRIIDRIDFTKFRNNPKWMIGYSDVTVLHSHIYNDGICSIHGTMPVNFFRHQQATDSLRTLLFGGDVTYTIRPHPLNRAGTCSGDLVGGNLSILYALSGSASEMNYKGEVLFIEDLDEYLYHIDRMMMQMKRSGKLKDLAGLIVGGMSDMKDNTVPYGKTAMQIIREAVDEYDYPVCFNFPAGHIDENFAFCHGRKIELNVESDKIHFQYSGQ
jgi:muramoyltetrapeptide carboxypeptidase